MTNPPPWPAAREEEICDCRVFRVHRLAATSPRTGHEHAFFRLDAPDWINVVPVTARGEIVLVRQWRHGAGRTTLEIPGGMVDPGETPAEAARRELREETGYDTERIEPLGVVNPNPALFANRCHTFLARDAVRVGDVENDGAEETVVELVPSERIPALLRDGVIDHALVVAALHWYALHNEEGAPQPGR